MTGVGAGVEVGAGGPWVYPHLAPTGLPPPVQRIVVGVAKDTHLRSAQYIISTVKGAKSRDTSNNSAKQKTQGVPIHQGAQGRNDMRYPGGLNNHLVMQ